MTGLSEQLAAVVENVGASVLRVEGRRIASAVVWSPDVVVTVASAVAGLKDVQLRGADGSTRPATVVGWDVGSDLAALRVQGDPLPVPGWSDGEALRVGNISLALGRPGPRVEPAWGLLRDLDGAWQSDTGGRIDKWIEVDGSLPRGFPGGPLVDAAGAVLGVNSRYLSRGGGTVPTVTVRRVVEGLLSGHHSRPGTLGAALYPVELEEGGRGLVVLKVDAEGPAAKAGIKQGDILLQLGDFTLAHPGQFLRWLADGKAGQEVTVRYRRGGVEHEGPLTFGERAPADPVGGCTN